MHIRTVMCLNLKSIFMLRKFSVHMCSAEVLGALTIFNINYLKLIIITS